MGSLRFMLQVVIFLLFLSQKDKWSWAFTITSQKRTLFHCLVTSEKLFTTRYLSELLAKMQSTLQSLSILNKTIWDHFKKQLLWHRLAPNGMILNRWHTLHMLAWENTAFHVAFQSEKEITLRRGDIKSHAFNWMTFASRSSAGSK